MDRWRPHSILLLLTAVVLLASCASQSSLALQNKKKADAARNLGEAYLRETRYTAALGEFLKAEQLNPDDAILQNDLGLVYMAKEKYDLALDHFQKAIKLKPDYSLAKNNLGSAYLIRKEWAKAIPVLEEVTRDMLYATPHFPLANLGWAYYNLGNYTKAEEYLRKALEIVPNFEMAQLNLGRTYMATGRVRDALKLFEEAAQNDPKNPALLLELGKAYRLLGDYGSARLALKGAIEFAEDKDLALEASNELKKIY